VISRVKAGRSRLSCLTCTGQKGRWPVANVQRLDFVVDSVVEDSEARLPGQGLSHCTSS